MSVNKATGPGICPKCGGSKVSYGTPECYDDSRTYPAHCHNCGTDYEEAYTPLDGWVSSTLYGEEI